MTSEELRALQAPLKQRYRTDPASAAVILRARAVLTPGAISCRVVPGSVAAEVGLHPATGGDGSLRCSGDMLLEALAGCAGVTLQAVATSMGIGVRRGAVFADGDWDARGTLGVSKEAPVGFHAIRLRIDLDSDATADQLDKLLQLTERYCVVAQSLVEAVPITISRS